jgi:hypothetical protein
LISRLRIRIKREARGEKSESLSQAFKKDFLSLKKEPGRDFRGWLLKKLN